jgi:hypothetical protein
MHVDRAGLHLRVDEFKKPCLRLLLRVLPYARGAPVGAVDDERVTLNHVVRFKRPMEIAGIGKPNAIGGLDQHLNGAEHVAAWNQRHPRAPNLMSRSRREAVTELERATDDPENGASVNRLSAFSPRRGRRNGTPCATRPSRTPPQTNAPNWRIDRLRAGAHAPNLAPCGHKWRGPRPRTIEGLC